MSWSSAVAAVKAGTGPRSRLTRQDTKAILDVTPHWAALFELRLLIARARNAKAKNGVMVLFGATAMVQDVREQMAIDQIMPVVAIEAMALQQARAPD